MKLILENINIKIDIKCAWHKRNRKLKCIIWIQMINVFLDISMQYWNNDIGKM